MKNQRETPIIIVKKKVHRGGHHGGAWKVAFADFMTAMMAMFLVLWIVGQSSDVKSAIAGHFQDPLGRSNEFGNSIVRGTGAQASNARTMMEQQIMELRQDRLKQMGARLRQRLQSEPNIQALEKQVEVTLVDEGLRIELLENSAGMFFELGSATPSGAGTDVLSILGAEFASLPNPVMVEGHTDSRQYRLRKDYSNWELSTDRANTARRIMVTSGLRPEQVLQVRGHADKDLRDPSNPMSPMNRRVTITMLLEYNLAADGEVATAGSTE